MLSCLLWAFNKWPTHLSKQEFNAWHKLTTMWKTSWGLSHWETHDKPTTSKTIYNDIEAFLATKWNSLHISRKKLDSLHPKPLPPNHRLHHNTKTSLPTAPQIIDLLLKLDDEQLSIYLEILDYASFAPLM